jgi:hypothetical protein
MVLSPNRTDRELHQRQSPSIRVSKLPGRLPSPAMVFLGTIYLILHFKKVNNNSSNNTMYHVSFLMTNYSNYFSPFLEPLDLKVSR